MDKKGWQSIHTQKEAKLYARNNVEWQDHSGSKKSGKVKQIMADRVLVDGDDGSLYIVSINKLQKVLNI